MKGRRRFFRSDVFLYIFLCVQITLWTQTKNVTPDFTIVPDPPSQLSVKAFSLGDEQFYFRVLAFNLQNFGDSFGRFTALYKYDYPKLYQWFTLLDILDEKSNFVPSLAAYYFSQSQNVADTEYVIDYLDEHASRDLYSKWWWMAQAVYLANHRLEDRERALELAYKLASTPRNDIPLWTKQMPAFIHERMGEEEQAMRIMADIINNIDNIDDNELNFMSHFVTERLQKYIDDKPELAPLRK